MALTQDQIAAQMVAQLRILDPSISAEVGSPERKIIDTVAQGIAESQVDLNLLSGALDLSAKFGSDLDAFVGLFAFGRQQGAFATGFVTFGRPTASAYSITIPSSTQVQATTTTTVNGVPGTATVTFQTTQAVTLAAGQTSVTAPIQALLIGTQGNVAATTITQFANVGAPVLGITTVTNALPTSNGADAETDAELKVRFRNTVFRNVAGTEDQYLALAVSTQFSTKATVLGPISRYQEYMQIPVIDDATSGTGQTITVVEPDGTTKTFTASDGTGNGTSGQWTTTPSNNPYAKYIYTSVPYFVSNGQTGASTLFYRQDYDYTLNAPVLSAGDTYREATESPSDIPNLSAYQPNLTFFSVYTGTDPTVQLPRPGDIVLLEYSYVSAASRNDPTRNVTNCVDVFVNGTNPTTTTATVMPPSGTTNLFTSNPTSKFYNQNFQRTGQPNIYPTVGNVFMGLFWQPVTALPSQIVAGSNTYLLNIHYFAVEDLTGLRNTIRARNGIEWNPTLVGSTTGDATVTVWTSGSSYTTGNIVYYNGAFYTARSTISNDSLTPSSDAANWSTTTTPFHGTAITSPGVTSFTVTGYIYNQNIVDLQAALDGSKQITTDVLAHAATTRYFKLDLTVVYAAGAGTTAANAAIATALGNYFAGQYFGSTIQLSDLLVLVRNVSGVQNVRWSNDVLNPLDEASNALNRVTECDINGNPLQATFTGTAANGSSTLTGVTVTTGTPLIGQFVTASGFAIGTTITAITGTTYTLSQSFTGANGSRTLTSTSAYNTDFILRDSELPDLPTGQVNGDVLPGLILRPRSANTFNLV